MEPHRALDDRSGVRMGGKSGRGTFRASDVVGCDNVRWRGGGVGEWVARGGLTCKSRVMQRSWQMDHRHYSSV